MKLKSAHMGHFCHLHFPSQLLSDSLQIFTISFCSQKGELITYCEFWLHHLAVAGDKTLMSHHEIIAVI